MIPEMPERANHLSEFIKRVRVTDYHSGYFAMILRRAAARSEEFFVDQVRQSLRFFIAVGNAQIIVMSSIVRYRAGSSERQRMPVGSAMPGKAQTLAPKGFHAMMPRRNRVSSEWADLRSASNMRV